ncbi:MAG: PLDc_N domain-containing protein [Myxococcales bacterium]|nr:PLDc_N domain-containing protein [Myxococcales bacterium]
MDERLLWMIAPLVALEVAMKIIALLHLRRHPRPRGSRGAWIAAILLLSLFGWLAYFLVGRGDEEGEDDPDDPDDDGGGG